MKRFFSVLTLAFLYIFFAETFSAQAQAPKGEDIVRLSLNLKPVIKINRAAAIASWLYKDYFKSPDSRQISVQKTVWISNNVSIYKIKLSDDFPTSMNKSFTIVYFDHIHIAFMIPVEFHQIMNMRGGKVMLGGYKETREFEYYRVYEVKRNGLSLVLNTADACSYGIKVGYYRNDDCIALEPNRLRFIREGVNAFRFEGMIEYFCEKGKDRSDNVAKPLYKKNISIGYRFFAKSSKWMITKHTDNICW